MKTIARFALLAAVAVGFALASAPAAQPPGGEKPPEPKTPEEKAAAALAAAELMTKAFELMDLGEKNKQPELYVGAFRLFVILDKADVAKLFLPLESKLDVQTADGKPVAGAKVETKPNESFKTLAEKCREEAEGLAEKEGRLDAVSKLLASIEKNPFTVGKRCAIGGPKIITRVIPPGQTHVHTIDFDTKTPGAIGFQASIPIRCKMQYETYVHFDQVVKFGQYGWKPKGDVGGKKTYTITIHNETKQAAEYKLFTN